MTPQLLLLFWREITLLGFLQVLECEKGRSIILTLRLGLGLVDDGPAIDYLGGTLLAFQPRPVTLAPLPSYHTTGQSLKSLKKVGNIWNEPTTRLFKVRYIAVVTRITKQRFAIFLSNWVTLAKYFSFHIFPHWWSWKQDHFSIRQMSQQTLCHFYRTQVRS